MPIKDPDRRREYFKQLMRKRRAGKPSKAATIEALRAEIDRLRHELEAARSAEVGRR